MVCVQYPRVGNMLGAVWLGPTYGPPKNRSAYATSSPAKLKLTMTTSPAGSQLFKYQARSPILWLLLCYGEFTQGWRPSCWHVAFRTVGLDWKLGRKSSWLWITKLCISSVKIVVEGVIGGEGEGEGEDNDSSFSFLNMWSSMPI